MKVDSDSGTKSYAVMLGALYSTKIQELKYMEKRQLTIYYHYTQSGKEVPFIRLQGQWLKSFGFHIGDKIEVRWEQNKLIITKREKQQ